MRERTRTVTSRAEQETTVSYIIADGIAHYYSSAPKDIKEIVGDDRFTVRRRSTDPENDWVDATLPLELARPLTRKKNYVQTEAQRANAAERMARARKAKKNTSS